MKDLNFSSTSGNQMPKVYIPCEMRGGFSINTELPPYGASDKNRILSRMKAGHDQLDTQTDS